MNDTWMEKEIRIGEIQSLLDRGYEIEVDSPDGWVGVNFFIDKGEWDEYQLILCDGRVVRVNENHLFETIDGWIYAKDMYRGKFPSYLILTDSGWVDGKVTKTGNRIPIVDIQVEHENHRYYTNGVSSHNTGVGKSLFMCHVAASHLVQGKNVLYITMEMAEERIAERIDANLLNLTMDELKVIDRDIYEGRIEKIAKKTQGKLIIKEYPTASAHAGHFRALLEELKLKREFKPDCIFIDYLNICASQRMKQGANVNSYTYVKAIAEELRGLAVEYNVPIVSATQTTRSGFCLDLNTILITKEGKKPITEVKIGDDLLSNDGWNTVKTIFPQVKKRMFRIRTESGKEIIASEDHVFPTDSIEKNIRNGLCLEDKLFINSIDH